MLPSMSRQVGVYLELETAEPPPLLYHGTPARSAELIEREGLRRMRRHHVHLSADVDTARRVGARRGQPIIFVVDAAAMRSAALVLR